MAKRCVCGAVMEDDMLFCTECGKKLETPAPAAKEGVCPKCGAALDPGDLFCTSCGCDLGKGGAAHVGKTVRTEPADGASPRRVIIGRVESGTPDPAMDRHFHAPGDL